MLEDPDNRQRCVCIEGNGLWKGRRWEGDLQSLKTTHIS